MKVSQKELEELIFMYPDSYSAKELHHVIYAEIGLRVSVQTIERIRNNKGQIV